MGVVLCGGASSRMGCDKGLMLRHGETWAGRIYNLLSPYAGRTVLSVKDTQMNEYDHRLKNMELIPDRVQIKGPLAGILSVHEVHPQKNLFVLACDLQDISHEILERLLVFFQKNPGYDFYVFENSGQLEPLCGIYTSRALRKSPQRDLSISTDFSLKRMLKKGNTGIIQSSPREAKFFHNYNTELSMPASEEAV